MKRAYAASALSLTLAAGASVAGEPGFVEEFDAGVAGWSGGAFNQVITSDLSGPGDPCLLVSTTSIGQAATRNLRPEYTGDLVADGVTGVSMYLRNLGGGDESLHMHVAVGTQLNFWISVDSFDPSPDEWGYFEVDFTDPSGWVRYRGDDTFENALRGADRLMIRHCPQPGDVPPADGVVDFAVDRITILPAGPGPCSAADLAEPLGQLDFSDVVAFLGAFGDMDPAADLAEPTGQWDFSDVVAFLTVFAAGCP